MLRDQLTFWPDNKDDRHTGTRLFIGMSLMLAVVVQPNQTRVSK